MAEIIIEINRNLFTPCCCKHTAAHTSERAQKKTHAKKQVKQQKQIQTSTPTNTQTEFLKDTAPQVITSETTQTDAGQKKSDGKTSKGRGHVETIQKTETDTATKTEKKTNLIPWLMFGVLGAALLSKKSKKTKNKK